MAKISSSREGGTDLSLANALSVFAIAIPSEALFLLIAKTTVMTFTLGKGSNRVG